MTRGGMKEYLEAIRGRYAQAGREEKGCILDEAVRVAGQHRKALIQSRRAKPSAGSGPKLGRPLRYGSSTTTALKTLREAGVRVCGKRLKPLLPELIEVLERPGEMLPGGETRTSYGE